MSTAAVFVARAILSILIIDSIQWHTESEQLLPVDWSSVSAMAAVLLLQSMCTYCSFVFEIRTVCGERCSRLFYVVDASYVVQLCSRAAYFIFYYISLCVRVCNANGRMDECVCVYIWMWVRAMALTSQWRQAASTKYLYFTYRLPIARSHDDVRL